MGVGHVHGPLGRGLSRRALRRLRQLVIRGAVSAQRLHRWGLHNTVAEADPMTALKPEPVEPTDTRCVTLRHANRRVQRTTAGNADNGTSQTAPCSAA